MIYRRMLVQVAELYYTLMVLFPQFGQAVQMQVQATQVEVQDIIIMTVQSGMPVEGVKLKQKAEQDGLLSCY